ncbi:MAG: hypothetical protein WD431_24970 [Cyclobacteriaceae bacterium]
MLDIEKVFLFSDSDKRDSFRAQIVRKDLDEEYLFSSKNTEDVVQFCWLQGMKFYDVIATGYPGIYLVSEKIQYILIGSGFNGYILRPITLKDKKDISISGYKLLSIISKVGSIENEKSFKKMMPPIVSWEDPYEAYIGLYFDVFTWDKSHFFYPEGTSFIFVVEEVKRLFEQKKVTNCRFNKVIDLENYNFL